MAASGILERLQSLSPQEIKILDQVLLQNPQAAAVLLKAFPELQAVMPQGAPPGPAQAGPGIAPAPAPGARPGFRGGGLVGGSGPGRADGVHASVPEGTFIIPADVVSAVGGGNTAAGAHHLQQHFGSVQQHFGSSSAGKGLGADRGVPVKLSGGEFAVPPHAVAAIGGGNLDAGSKALGAGVAAKRDEYIRHLQSLPSTRK